MKHTPGPWEWRINLKSKVVSLVSVSGGHWVMGFARYGMGGAAPEFIGEDGLLSRAECFAKPVPGREHHSHWFQTLDNPNAKLIAAAPELLEALQMLVQYSDFSNEAEHADFSRQLVKSRAVIAKATA